MAAPGGSKSRFVEAYFDPLWAMAEEALKGATRVMVVGYSFPDTDPTAQLRLLGALEQSKPDLRWVYVVLGADVTSASRRMLSLMASTSSGRVFVEDRPTEGLGQHIVHLPLGAQDFIARHASFTGP
jgi:hypothetical protein